MISANQDMGWDFSQGFGAGAGSREPAIKIDGSETLILANQRILNVPLVYNLFCLGA